MKLSLASLAVKGGNADPALDAIQDGDYHDLLDQVSVSRWGRYAFGSPVWNDIEDMVDDPDELPGLYQIFGHSQQDKDPVIGDHIACLDCRRAFIINDKGSIQEL